jgi:hypothetical protein
MIPLLSSHKISKTFKVFFRVTSGEVESAASSMDSELEAFNYNFFDLKAFNSPKTSKNSKSQKTSKF